MDEFQKNILSKRHQTQKRHTLFLYSCDTAGQAAVICGDKSHSSSGVWRGEMDRKKDDGELMEVSHILTGVGLH